MSNNYPNPFSKKIVIEDATTTLPWHPTRMWGKRPLSYIKYIIVHQSACTATFEQINKAHISPGSQNHLSKAGAPHICYHMGLEPSGNILQMNSFEHITWHCKGVNMYSIGINVNGNFPGKGWKGKKDPTNEQIIVLHALLDHLYKNDFKHLTPSHSLYGHSHFDRINRSGDPGFVLEDEIQKFINNFKK